MVVSDSFGVKVVNGVGRAIVFVRGDIDLASSQAFWDALLSAQGDAPEVIVDLGEVTFMDSTGIHALLGAYRRAQNRGSLAVVGPSPAVRRVFEITGVSELLLIEPQPLTWRQVTFHTSGWRQWMTVETTEEGRPVAEIVEVGPGNDFAGDGGHYALETSGATTRCGSLDEAMRAAERLGSVASKTSQR